MSLRPNLFDEDRVEGEEELHDVWQVHGIGQRVFHLWQRPDDGAVHVFGGIISGGGFIWDCQVLKFRS